MAVTVACPHCEATSTRPYPAKARRWLTRHLERDHAVDVTQAAAVAVEVVGAPVAPARNLRRCQLDGCHRPVMIGESGQPSSWCSTRHKRIAKKLRRQQAADNTPVLRVVEGGR